MLVGRFIFEHTRPKVKYIPMKQNEILNFQLASNLTRLDFRFLNKRLCTTYRSLHERKLSKQSSVAIGGR